MTSRLHLRSTTTALLITVALTCAQGCNLVPTSPSDNSPEAYCSAVGAFYCNTTITMASSLPNGWGGYCMVGDSTTTGGIVGYSGVTSNGGAFPVTASQSTMSQMCYPSGLPRICVSIVRCTRR